MQLRHISLEQMVPVPGVFGVNPIIQGEEVCLGRNRRGTPELLQHNRVIALGEPDLLLSFATLNHLDVKGAPKHRAEAPVKVFELD